MELIEKNVFILLTVRKKCSVGNETWKLYTLRSEAWSRTINV